PRGHVESLLDSPSGCKVPAHGFARLIFATRKVVRITRCYFEHISFDDDTRFGRTADLADQARAGTDDVLETCARKAWSRASVSAQASLPTSVSSWSIVAGKLRAALALLMLRSWHSQNDKHPFCTRAPRACPLSSAYIQSESAALNFLSSNDWHRATAR